MATSLDFASITRQRLLKEVFGSLPKTGWYAAVVDNNTLGVLSTHMKMSELLDFNVSVVESLELGRKPCKEAVYFISPTKASINRLLDDFSGDRPVYEHAYVFFSSKLQHENLYRIRAVPQLVERLKALKEVHVEFQSVEKRTFVTADERALRTLFGAQIDHDERTVALNKCAARLATVFTTLKSPLGSIVYRMPQDLPEMLHKNERQHTCRELALLVQERLKLWANSDNTLFSGTPADLIVLDRGHDPVAPIIHPFQYASMTHDLLHLKDGVFTYKWTDAKGKEQTSEHRVDVSDPMWAELRHSHVAEVVTVASQRLKEFTNSRLARVEREGARNSHLGKATSGLPEYLERKSQLTMHVTLTQRIFSEINARDLINLGRLEQGIVFGEKKSKDIITAMRDWNSPATAQKPTAADKMRLLLCYIATHPGRLDRKLQDNWTETARLSPEQMHTCCNVQYLGVELEKQKRSNFAFAMRGKPKSLRTDRTSPEDVALENGRFQPLLTETVAEFIRNRLAYGDGWEVIKANSDFDAGPGGDARQGVSGAKSMRTTNRPQPTWHKSLGPGSSSGGAGIGQFAPRNRVVVIFVVGGCTWSEIQAAHELSQQHGIEIVLGSTNIIEGGEDFLNQLAHLAPYRGQAQSLSGQHPGHGQYR